MRSDRAHRAGALSRTGGAEQGRRRNSAPNHSEQHHTTATDEGSDVPASRNPDPIPTIVVFASLADRRCGITLQRLVERETAEARR